MGFQRRRKVYKLDFSGTEYEGFEVRVSGLTTGEYLDIVGAAATDQNSKETQTMLRLFAKHIVSWNLEDEDGDSVPPSYEGVKSMEFTMVMFVINAWTDALVTVPDGVGKESKNGASPLVASIPTESL